MYTITPMLNSFWLSDLLCTERDCWGDHVCPGWRRCQNDIDFHSCDRLKQLTWPKTNHFLLLYFQSTDEWSITLPAWFASHYLASHRRTWRMTFILSLKVVFVWSYRQLTIVPSHTNTHATLSVTEVFPAASPCMLNNQTPSLWAQNLHYDQFKHAHFCSVRQQHYVTIILLQCVLEILLLKLWKLVATRGATH